MAQSNHLHGRLAAPSAMREARKGKTSKQPGATIPPELTFRQQPRAPKVAIQAMADQAFTFGTSSQLARQAAISKGNSYLEDDQDPLDLTASPEKASALHRDNIATSLRFRGKRSLWSAAARDRDGFLLENEKLAFKDESGAGPQDLDASLIDMRKVTSEVLTQAGFLALEEIEGFDDAVSRSPTKSGSRSSRKPVPAKPVQHSVSEAALRKRFKRDLTTHPSKSDKSSAKRRSSAKKGQDLCGDRSETMPDFASYAMADLKYALNSLGFKPSKRREIMVATLQECWRSKRRLALESMDPNKQRLEQVNDAANGEKQLRSVMDAPAEDRENNQSVAAESEGKASDSTRRKRGRPRKVIETDPDASAPKTTRKRTKKGVCGSPSLEDQAARPALEPKVLDHQTATVPADVSLQASAPQRPAMHPRETSTSVLSSITKTTLSPDPTDSRGYVLSKITEAVLSERPTHDATHPSWHEKILLYDPIVLEDLAAWLNAGALGCVGCDDEVGLAEVKEWCRARSVCCVGRLTLRGQARQRL